MEGERLATQTQTRKATNNKGNKQEGKIHFPAITANKVFLTIPQNN